MNMISTGAFLEEMDASDKQKNSLVNKLVSAWEQKNSKTARAGGVSLMALSLAACGSSDDTSDAVSYTQAQLDAATAAATATAEATAATAQTAAVAAATTAATTAAEAAAATAATAAAATAAAAQAAAVAAATAAATPAADLVFNKGGTTDLDTLNGTSGNDAFTAIGGRMNDGDSADGGAGSDTLTATVSGSSDAWLTSIETLNITAIAASEIIASQTTGVTNVNVLGTGTLTFSSAASGVAYNVGGTAGLLVTESGTDTAADAITVTLSGSGALGTLTLGNTTGTDIEVVNIVAAGATSVTLTEGGTPDFTASGDKIVVTGSDDLTIKMTDSVLGSHASAGVQATIDASGHTGALTMDIGAIGIPGTDNLDFFNLTSFTGVDTLKFGTNSGSGGLTTMTGADTGMEMHVTSAEAATDDITIIASATAADDTLGVTVGSATAGTSIAIDELTVDGFETLTLTSGGTSTATATVANTVDGVNGLSSDTVLNIAGSTAFTVNNIEASWTDINVSNTAGVTMVLETGGAMNVAGGSGNDSIGFDTVADLTKADTINGGDGTDTLSFSAVVSDMAATAKAVVSNMEILEFTGANDITAANAAVTIDLTTLTGVNHLKLTGASTFDAVDVLTVKGDTGFVLTTGANVTSANTAELDIVITNAANAGTNDTVTLNLDAELASGNGSMDGMQIDNVENLNINVKGTQAGTDAHTIDDIDGAQLTSVTIASTAGTNATTGKANVSEKLVITTAESTLLTTIDASAATGDVDVSGLGAKIISTGGTLTGGSAVDTMTGGAGADVISGNAGADVLLGGAGNDTITGGAGADSITGEAGSDNLTGGAGDDTFVLTSGSLEAAYDKISDYTAAATDVDNDTLNLNANDVTIEADVAVGSATDVKAATTDTDTSVTAYITSGMIKLAGTESANVNTLGEWIDVAELMAVSDTTITTNSTDSATVAFEFNGNTYVLMETTTDSAATETVATSAVVELTGVTGIDAISATAAANTILIA